MSTRARVVRAVVMPGGRPDAWLRPFGGGILTAGGIDGSNALTGSASMFDPATGAWAPITSLPGPGAPVLVRLGDGTVLAIASRTRSITSVVYRISP